MALQISIPYPASGSSVSATYHNIGSLNGAKSPDAVNGPNNWQVEFLLASYACQSDRANGVAALTSTRYLAPVVAADQPLLPQLYAYLLTLPAFSGATSV